MQRGVIILSKELSNELIKNIDLTKEKIKNTPLMLKMESLNDSLKNEQNQNEYKLELSEEEVEYILDEISGININDNPVLFELYRYISNFFSTLKSN